MNLVLWLLCAAPLVDLVGLAVTNGLGTNPQETLLRATGTWALTLLLVTLGITPVRQWLHWPELIRVRRLLGLWTFTYAVVHLLGFWAFEHDFVWLAVLGDSLKRPFVTVGLLAFVLMIPMAVTSNRWSMLRLGSRWKTIHRAVYWIAGLACVHFFLHRAGKNNFADPVLALTITVALLSLRQPWRYWRSRR